MIHHMPLLEENFLFRLPYLLNSTDGVFCLPYTRFLVFQVTNTPWGERVSFVFNPNSDLVAKPLHVSPFMVSFIFL